MKKTPGDDRETCSCLSPPLPIELLAETDTLRKTRGGKGRSARKGIGRTETSGVGTAYFNASETVGPDLKKHIGPVPGTGFE